MFLTRFFAFLVVLLVGTQGLAQSVTVPVQGLLADAQGVPIDESRQVTFKVYSSTAAGSALWSETQTVDVSNGLFTVFLGGVETLNASLFADHRTLWLSMTVQGDTESDRLPMATAPYAAFADKATDANTLQGLTPAQLTTSGGAVNAVDVGFNDSQTQLGAANTQAALEALLARIDALENGQTQVQTDLAQLQTTNTQLNSAVTQLQAENTSLSTRLSTLEGANLTARLTTLESTVTNQGSLLTTLEGAFTTLQSTVTTLTGNLNSVANTLTATEARVTGLEADLGVVETTIAAHETQITDLETDVTAHEGQLVALEEKTASMTATATDVYFTGVNVNVRSGSGSTIGTVNGRGNLVIGYGEPRTTGALQTGSHNLIMGFHNNYTRYAGIVGGNNNSITGNYASVLSGSLNEASGPESVIVTGTRGSATNTTAAILAGYENTASGYRSAVVSGWINNAAGSYSVVVSGHTNTATGTQSSVLGGRTNNAQTADSSVGGGLSQTAATSSRFIAQGTLNP